MKKSEIKNQLSNAENAAKEAEKRFEEAKCSTEDLIAKSKRLVDERSNSSNKAKEEKNCANSLVDNLKSTFQNAKRKLDSKFAEIKCIMRKISYLRNCYMNYYDKYQKACLETAHLEARASYPSNTPEQRAMFKSQLELCRKAEANLRQWMETYFDELCRQTERLPKIEHEAKEFENLVNELRPKLELANRQLEEAKEREIRADVQLHEAMAIMEHNKELGQAKINEAATERDRCLKLVEEWKRTLSSAFELLNNYTIKQYD